MFFMNLIIVTLIYTFLSFSLKLNIVREKLDKIEIVFKNFLYEDRKVRPVGGSGDGGQGPPNYVDFLCHIHKEIRAQLSK